MIYFAIFVVRVAESFLGIRNGGQYICTNIFVSVTDKNRLVFLDIPVFFNKY